MQETAGKLYPARFPKLAWAWPSGGLHQLLRAAVTRRDEDAMDAFAEWSAANDIDAVGFREHRLLAAIAARLGRRLQHLPSYPRLAGLQRLMWTRSRMLVRDSLPSLSALVESEVDVMLIKGASRIALQSDAQKARVAHDLDILVRPEQFAQAFEVLDQRGWASATGESGLRLRTRMDSIRAVNMYHGQFGDIDLHRFAFHPSQGSLDDDRWLWERAKPADFFGVPVHVPSDTDRLLLSVAHGSLDGHAHSDWLVDCAEILSNGKPDWDLLIQSAEARGIVTQTAVALGYLQHRLGLAVPETVLAEFLRNEKAGAVRCAARLLEMKPRTEAGKLASFGRFLTKSHRLLTDRRNLHSASAPTIGANGSFKAIQTARESTGGRLSHRLCSLSLESDALCRLELRLHIALPAARRRIEFELNSNQRHIARLWTRTYQRAARSVEITFRGKVALTPQDRALILEARPGRYIRGRGKADIDRYAPIAFEIISFDLDQDIRD